MIVYNQPMEFKKHGLTPKTVDISDWYNKVVTLSELADYGPVKGTMIFRPYGYRIWELVQEFMDLEIKSKGIENAYFPLLIPESLLNKEKDHVEGFSPELAVVTIGGGEQLSEPVVVRPTSETVMYEAYARWIQSWRDLPILINQWNNVVRWERRTYLFLRTSEFLWQEGHTAHVSHEEALEYVRWAMAMYAKTYRELFALPGIVGWKSQSEKFAGAVDSITFESLMPGGKALQSCTSHDLGQNFSEAFNISFLDKEGQKQFAWQTSWGFSTRSLGGLILSHGDDQGLVLPPKLAPYQAVILPVKQDPMVLEYANKLMDRLMAVGVRVKLDAREDESMGYRINKWELKGVPVRIEIGPKEVEEETITAVRRDVKGKLSIKLSEIESKIVNQLDEIQLSMLQTTERYLSENTHEVSNYDDFKKIMENDRGFLVAHWCEDSRCEAKIKEETKATTRCLPLDSESEKGTCIYCGQPATHRWYFAISY